MTVYSLLKYAMKRGRKTFQTHTLKPDPFSSFPAPSEERDSTSSEPSRITGSGSRRNIGSGGNKTDQPGGKIKPEESNVSVTGSGKEASGYYNISLVRYDAIVAVLLNDMTDI